MSIADDNVQPRSSGRLTTSMVLTIGLVGAVLYAFANWTTFAIGIPGTDDVSLRPQFAIVVFIGFAFGPLAGFVAGFIGNVVGDWLTGFDLLRVWQWSLANGTVGLLSGIFGAMLVRRVSAGVSRGIMAGAAGVVATVLGFGWIWVELWTQDLSVEFILTREYLPTVVVNSVVAAVITPLVVRFWEPLHSFFGEE